MNTVHFQPSEEFSKQAEEIFLREKKKILKLLSYADVQHVGSTAIPHALTKGDLDINVRVPKEHFIQARDGLTKLYIVDKNNIWSDIVASFIMESLTIPVGIQLTAIGTQYDDFVNLRDLFIDNPQLVTEYNKLKLQFQGKDMQEYRKAKEKFLQKIRPRQ